MSRFPSPARARDGAVALAGRIGGRLRDGAWRIALAAATAAVAWVLAQYPTAARART